MDNTQQSGERKQRYKLILDQLHNLKDSNIEENFSEDHLKELQASIKSNDEIHKEGSAVIEELLNNNTEVLMDAHVLKSQHEVVSKLFTFNSEFNDRIYRSALISLAYQDDIMNWEVITEIAVGVACTTCTKSSMLGATDIELKQRVIKERQKRQSTRAGEEKRPQNVNKLKRNDAGAEKVNVVLKQVNELFKANNFVPIPYYKLVIDPNNFMNTVENAFQLAFLARDGNIAIETGQDSYPQVRCVRVDEIFNSENTSQSICRLNVQYCQEMVSFYNLTQPMLQVCDDLNESDDGSQNSTDDDD